MATGDPEAVWRLYTDGMPPEWFASMRNGPRCPLYERMAPTLAADAEAMAWTRPAPRAELWAAVDVPVLVLLDTDTFPFMAERAPGGARGPRRPARRRAPDRAQRTVGSSPLELMPGMAPARKASTKWRWSSWVRRA